MYTCDIVFLFDTSGSMYKYISKVEEVVNDFTSNLNNNEIDYRLGIVTFEYDVKSYDFTSNIDEFKNTVNSILNTDGGSEYGLTALEKAMTMNFRSDAGKYFVLMTDEPYEESRSKATDIINELKKNNIRLDVIGLNDSKCNSAYAPIVNATGGGFYDIKGHMPKIFKNLIGGVNIPDNALTYNGHSYYVYSDVNGIDTWEAAKNYCENQGGYLAVINDSDENNAIYNYVKICGYKNAYFGLTDSKTEGTWEWSTGDSVNYTNWGSIEPNSERSDEDYAEFYYKYTDGKWNDGNFGHGTVGDSKTFICEWDTSRDTAVFYDTLTTDELKNLNSNSLAYIQIFDSIEVNTPLIIPSSLVNVSPMLKFFGGLIKDVQSTSVYNSAISLILELDEIVKSTIAIATGKEVFSNKAHHLVLKITSAVDKIKNFTEEFGALITVGNAIISNAAYVISTAQMLNSEHTLTTDDQKALTNSGIALLGVDFKVVAKMLSEANLGIMVNKVTPESIKVYTTIGNQWSSPGLLNIVGKNKPVTGGLIDVIVSGVIGAVAGIDEYNSSLKKYIEDGLPYKTAIKESRIDGVVAGVREFAHNFTLGLDDALFKCLRGLTQGIWHLVDRNKTYYGNDKNYMELIGEWAHLSSLSDIDIYGDDSNNELTLIKEDNGTNVYTRSGDDYISNNVASNVSIYSGHGNDTIFSHEDALQNYMFAGPGTDFIVAHDKGSTIHGGNDNDKITVSPRAHVKGGNRIHGDSGNDIIMVNNTVGNTVNGGLGDDIIAIEEAKDIVIEYENGDGTDYIFGYDSNDTISMDRTDYITVSGGNNEQDIHIIVGNGTIILGEAKGKQLNIKTGLRSLLDIQKNGSTYEYTGGNRSINNYMINEKIKLTSDVTGIGLTADSFIVNSTSGELAIKSARGKVLEFTTDDNNTVAYALMASGGGDIDGSRLSQFEVIIGSKDTSNRIIAGSGGSSLWGGAETNDILTGGSGQDNFFYGKNDGADIINNASSNDIITLYDICLADINSSNISGRTIVTDFKGGGTLQINSSENISAIFQLSDGSFRLNHSSGEWQNA